MTESSKQRPPREFWILPLVNEQGEVVDADAWITLHDATCGIPDEDKSSFVHVIEASYAKELEAKLAVAVKALERISGKEVSCFNSNLNRCDYVAIQALEQLKAGL